MSVTVAQFASLVAEQKTLFERFGKLLKEVTEAAKAKDGLRVAALTPQLVETQSRATSVDEEMRRLAEQGAAERGMPIEQFRLSVLDPSGSYQKLIDEAREATSSVARQASQAAGVLAANVGIIEDTIKVLESIDARSAGYGPERPTPRSTSKLFDHSA